MLNTSFSPWPHFSKEEQDAVGEVLASGRVNYWTGTEARDFETEFASFSDVGYAVAVTNGTVALDLALRALNVGPGDEVIVAPRTFIASASCVVNCGAVPIFADVDLDSGNVTAATIERCITNRTKAVLVVHLAGWPCQMTQICELACQHDLRVIEDCAQAHGARIDGKSVGSWGDIGAWSFCQDKIMSTGGEGGMVTTNDPDLWRAMWEFKDHGKSYEAVYERSHPPGFRWLHESIGTNWRMTEIEATLGRFQLRRMAEWTARRSEIALAYRNCLARFDDLLRSPLPPSGTTHAYYRYYAYLRTDRLKKGWDRDRIVAEVNEKGGLLMHGTCSEIYLEKAFTSLGLGPKKRLPNAKELGETSLMFLTHPTLTDAEIEQITEALDSVLAQCRR